MTYDTTESNLNKLMSENYYILIPDWVLGYNDLNHLALPGRWWLQNFILRHIYKIL